MLSTMLQSLIAPRYPRRYIGRHRARLTIRLIARMSNVPSVAAQRRAEPNAEQTAA